MFCGRDGSGGHRIVNHINALYIDIDVHVHAQQTQRQDQKKNMKYRTSVFIILRYKVILRKLNKDNIKSASRTAYFFYHLLNTSGH